MKEALQRAERNLPVLGYWDTRSIGEAIRLLLRYTGVRFVDRRYRVGHPSSGYDKSEWYQEKYALGLPCPNLPYFLEPATGLRLTQSNAILMHIAEQHPPLAGGTAKERSAARVALGALGDWQDPSMFLGSGEAPTPLRYSRNKKELARTAKKEKRR